MMKVKRSDTIVRLRKSDLKCPAETSDTVFQSSNVKRTLTFFSKARLRTAMVPFILQPEGSNSGFWSRTDWDGDGGLKVLFKVQIRVSQFGWKVSIMSPVPPVSEDSLDFRDDGASACENTRVCSSLSWLWKCTFFEAPVFWSLGCCDWSILTRKHDLRRAAVGAVAETGEGSKSGDDFVTGALSPQWKDAPLFDPALQCIIPSGTVCPKCETAVIRCLTNMLRPWSR